MGKTGFAGCGVMKDVVLTERNGWTDLLMAQKWPVMKNQKKIL
jgi:hypothetical protein